MLRLFPKFHPDVYHRLWVQKENSFERRAEIIAGGQNRRKLEITADVETARQANHLH